MKEIITMLITAKEEFLIGIKGLFEISKVLGSVIITCPIIGIFIAINYAKRKKHS